MDGFLQHFLKKKSFSVLSYRYVASDLTSLLVHINCIPVCPWKGLVFFLSYIFTFIHSVLEWEHLLVLSETLLRLAFLLSYWEYWNGMIICVPTEENKFPLSKYYCCGLPHLLHILWILPNIHWNLEVKTDITTKICTCTTTLVSWAKYFWYFEMVDQTAVLGL